MHPILPSKSRHYAHLQLLWGMGLAWVCLWVATSEGEETRWHSGSGYRRAPLRSLSGNSSGFSRMDPLTTGVQFTNSVSESLILNNQILENGAGMTAGDVDGDGLNDLFFCSSGGVCQLYRNLGNWRFEDITTRAGVGCAGQFSTGACLVDVDGDGDLDLLVNGLGTGTRLFLNNGEGVFREDRQSGLELAGAATSMALADIDGDGDLDLYVTRYRITSARNDPDPPKINAQVVNGVVKVTPADRFFGVLRTDGRVEVVEKGEVDRLYLNDGHGKFSAVSWTDGRFLDENGNRLTAAPEDWGLSVLLRDLNGDGKVDIYVCNDFFRSRDRFWLGDGKGGFKAVDQLAWRAMPLSSMAMDAGDLNRDGVDDFIVVEMLSRDPKQRKRQRANALKVEHNLPLGEPRYQPEVLQNTVHLGRGDGTFAEIAFYTGLAATDWSWNVGLYDLDLDGWEDVVIAAGNNHDVLDLDAQNALDRAPPNSSRRGLQFYPPLLQRPLIFHNQHNLTFREVSGDWGLSKGRPGIWQGMVVADLDGDGDLDLVLGQLNGEVQLFRNNCTAARVAIQLHSRSFNSHGVGAEVKLIGGPVEQRSRFTLGGHYLSSDPLQRMFAVGGSNSNELALEVRWPSGRLQRIAPVEANHLYEIEEPLSIQPQPTHPLQPSPTLFEDISAVAGHFHRDKPFDDFALQPLLPGKLSQRGPGIAWVEGETNQLSGWMIGSGAGGRIGLILPNKTTGSWRSQILSNVPPATLDQLAVLPLGKELMLSQSHYEMPTSSLPALVSLKQEEQGWRVQPTAFPELSGSHGPLAAADLDQDGELEILFAGQSIAGRFPESTGSLILKQSGSGWSVDASNSGNLASLNLVSAAVFTDLDGDGDADLAVACEWGPLKLFRNDHGHLMAWNPAVSGLDWIPASHRPNSFEELTGQWHGIAAGDFDGDGRMDLVASNEGENVPHSAWLPWHLYFGDLSGNGGVDLVEAYEPTPGARPLPWRARDVMVPSWPQLQERYPTFYGFAEATVQDLLGESYATAGHRVIRLLASVILRNTGTGFEVTRLPPEAQFAPAFGIAVADFDGDGHEDLFVAQNFFPSHLDDTRKAAGRGLLLLGDGRGGFRPMAGQQSGIRIPGEQRAAATADMDGNGRADLAVTQNRGATKIFLNRKGNPGLRVHLEGPSGNRFAYGASARLLFGDRAGARREWHGGSGYLSCDSPTAVLALPAKPTRIEVRWPDGKTSLVPLRGDERELRLKQ